MATTVTDDSYSTPIATDLIVGQDADFQQGGAAASVNTEGKAGSFVTGTPAQFNEQGTAGITTASGFSGTASLGFLVGGAVSDKAEVGVTGFAGSVTAGEEEDWQARISGPGVVWYQDFRHDDEVDNFREIGGIGNDVNDVGAPGTIFRQTADGVTGGGCLECFRPQGTTEGAAWYRPFSPLDTGSGKTVNDPGADGSLPAQAWAPTQGSLTIQNWHVNAARPGFYGPIEYHDTFSANSHDGVGYYLQMRVKRDPRRTAATNTDNGPKRVGKLNYITISNRSNVNQELVTYSGGVAGTTSQGAPQYHRVYDGKAFGPLEDSDSLLRPGQQVGKEDADYSGGTYCDIGTQPGECWSYSGGWDTLLYHIVPGLDSQDDTRIVIYAAHDGETEYTRIWDLIVDIQYDGDQAYTGDYNGPTGYNAVIASTYQNGEDMGVDFWERFDQFILSQEFIPCPGNSALTTPDWFTNLSHKEAVAPVSNWLGASGVKEPASGLNNHEAIITAWTGMGVDQRRKIAFMTANGGHNDYLGNEVYSVDFSSESPEWTRRRDASVPSAGLNLAKWSDGRPTADHNGNLMVSAEGRWFQCGMNATNRNGNAHKYQWWEYDVGDSPYATVGGAVEDYVDLGGLHDSSGGDFGTAVYDKGARQVINITSNNYVPGITFTDIDAIKLAAGVENNVQLNVSEAFMAAVDTKNKILMLWANNYYRWLKIDSDANRQGSLTTPSVSGTAPNKLNQIHWHSASQAFITWGGGNTIAKLTPTVSGGNYTGLAWTSVAVSGATLPSAGPPAGMWDKVNFVEDMGNGDAALIIVPVYANPDTWVIRLNGAI